MSLSRLFRCALVPAAIFSLGAAQVLAQGETGTIQGRVFLEGTRDPVVGALVRAMPPLFRPDGDRENRAVPVEGVTDKNGRFALNWMTSGIWETTASAEGFTDSMLRIEVSQSASNVCTATGMLHCNMPIEFYTGISILPAPDGTFIHPRAADPTKLSSSHNRPAPEAVTSAPADVQPTGAPYFQGIPQTPLHTCGLSSPGGLRSTRRASASRHWQRPDPP